MNWCISLHWKQLPRLRQEEGEAGGEEGKAEGREPLGRKGSGRPGEKRGKEGGDDGEEAKMRRWKCWT